MRRAEELGVGLQSKDITREARFKEELQARGGKIQVPFLVDEKEGKMMYESDDIIAYITPSADRKNFERITVHKSEGSSSVCI